tara:strand:+ start:28009 stop:28221 length:213 start_codon:yes stop_codon:yes gene_type:complete
MTTYNITVNKTEKATTTSFEAMKAFIKSFSGECNWSVDYIENNEVLNLKASGMNSRATFSECLISFRFGR